MRAGLLREAKKDNEYIMTAILPYAKIRDDDVLNIYVDYQQLVHAH